MRSGRPNLRARASSAALTALVLVLVAAPAVLAAEPTPPPAKLSTAITISGPTSITIGGDVTLAARLTTAAGAPIAGMRLILGIRSVDSHTTRSDGDGVAEFRLPSDELTIAGTIPVSVTFDGDSTYAGTVATGSIVVQPAAIVVVTVPAVAGVRMTLGETEALTNEAGLATFLVERVGRVQLAPDLELPIGSGMQLSFVRWEDDVFNAARTVNVQGDERFVLGLRTAVQTNFRFVDPRGQPVDPATVESVKLVAASGQDRTITSYDQVWLEGSIPAKRTAGLIAVRNFHRISEVIIAGTNVVNRGQQVFEPAPGGVVTVHLLLYDLQVRAEDALLRWPVVTEVRLEFPDGSVRSGSTDANGSLVFSGLPRGDYTIRLGASGIVPPSPIALSRPQRATIRVLSTLDLSLAGGALLIAVVMLVLLGRRHQVQSAAGRAVELAGTAANQAVVAAEHSDRTARALFAGASVQTRALLGQARTRALLGQRRARAPLGAARPRPAAVRVDVEALRSRLATIANRSWTVVRGLTDEQRLRLIVGVAVVGMVGFAAVVAAVGLPPGSGSGSATPSASSIASATATPHPTPVQTAPGVAELRSVIQVNTYLAQDHIALETALSASPVSTADLVSLLRQLSLHVRVASETLARVDPPAADAPVIASLASLYALVGTETLAALSVTVSDAATYQANAAAIAALVVDVSPLTTQVQALMDELVATPGGDPGATRSAAPSASG